MRNYLILFFVLLVYLTYAQEYRSIDGYGNNLTNLGIGARFDLLNRESAADYIDGIEIPKLDESFNRPNPRVISNFIFDQNATINDKLGLSDFTWVFGQFIDHDLVLVENSNTEVLNNIVIPQGDKFFVAGSTIPMLRSNPAPGTGTGIQNPRNYQNSVTSFLDGSAIYGSDLERASWLRTHNFGKLKTSSGNLLPWNTVDGEFNSAVDLNAPSMADDTRSNTKLFIAGDVRANENPLLIAMHTLFVREHNRICDQLLSQNVTWDDERLYQEARRLNVAKLQYIVFNEWLPSLGITIPKYSGYQEQVNPRIMNVFSAAAFRIGHTLISSNLIRMDNTGHSIPSGNIRLKDAFFNPITVILGGGIDTYLKGMGTQVEQDLDCKVIDDVRNFLFGSPGAGGLDLVSININRGRERGLPNYNALREAFGLPKVPSFYELTHNQEEANVLESAYGNIENVDPWVGMLAELNSEGSLMGKLMQTIIERQFRVLRDGDRFYFENDPSFTPEELAEIKKVKMRDIVMNNTEIKLMQDQVFTAMPHDQIIPGPHVIPVELQAEVTPNPAFEKTNVQFYIESDQDVAFDLIDMNGKTILTQKAHFNKGQNSYELKFPEGIPLGMYNVVIRGEINYNIVKVIVR